MKKPFLFIAIFILITSLKAESSTGKLYIEPEQVRVEKNQLTIQLLGNIIPVTGIYTDEQGLHVLTSEILDQHTFSYTCPLGHSSPDGSGMCNQQGCPFQKNKK